MITPIPIPVPTDTYTNVRASRPLPYVRSPTAARFASLSSVTVGRSASRSELITPGRLQPGRFGACRSRSLSGSNTPGPPTTV